MFATYNQGRPYGCARCATAQGLKNLGASNIKNTLNIYYIGCLLNICKMFMYWPDGSVSMFFDGHDLSSILP